MDYDKKEALRREGDQALNAALCWVGGAIGLEGLMVLVNRYYINFLVTDQGIQLALMIDSLLKGLPWLGLICCLGGLLLGLSQWKKRGSCTTLVPVLGIGGAALAFCAQITLAFQGEGVQMLLWLVPGWAGLALVFFLYQREFFVAAILSALGILGLWFVRHGGVTSVYTLATVGALVLLTGLVFWLWRNQSCLKPQGQPLISPEANYLLLFLSGGLSLGMILLSLGMNQGMAYYLSYGMIAWLFVLLVYYTVKMM